MKKSFFLIFILTAILSQSIVAQEYKTTKKDYLAAISEKYLDKALDLINAKDYEALQKLIDKKVVFWLKEGLKVQVVDRTWTGTIKIRPKGKLVEVWTFAEAVE